MPIRAVTGEVADPEIIISVAPEKTVPGLDSTTKHENTHLSGFPVKWYEEVSKKKGVILKRYPGIISGFRTAKAKFNLCVKSGLRLGTIASDEDCLDLLATCFKDNLGGDDAIERIEAAGRWHSVFGGKLFWNDK